MKRILIIAVIIIAVIAMVPTTAYAETSAPDTDVTLTVERTIDTAGGIGTYFSVSFKENFFVPKDPTTVLSLDLTSGNGSTADVDSRLSTFYESMLTSLKAKYGSYVGGSLSTDRVTVYIYFESYTEYYMAHGIDGFTYEEDDDSTIKETGFFYDTYVTVTKTMFSEEYHQSYLYTDFLQPMSEFAESFGKSVGKVYVYGTKYTRAITSDADYTELDDGIRYHYYYIDDPEREITLKQSSPNTGVTYGLIIGIGVLVAAATATVVIVMRKKEKKDARR